MNLLLGVCLALGIGLLAGTVFRKHSPSTLKRLIGCGGLFFAIGEIAFHSALRVIFPDTSLPEQFSFLSSVLLAPLLFFFGTLVSVVGYQIASRVNRSGSESQHQPISRRWLHWLPAVIVLLSAGFLTSHYWVTQRQLAAKTRLKEIAQVNFLDREPDFPLLRSLPENIRPKLVQRNVASAVHFHPSIKNPGRYIQECGFDRLYKVEFLESEINATDVIALVDNTALRYLSFTRCRISEDALDTLRAFPILQHLEIRECSISLNGRGGGTALPNSQLHEPPEADVCDPLLKGVSGHPALYELKLADTPISNQGLAHLRGLTNLHLLDLSRTRVRGAGLRGLICPQLYSLSLDGTQADDSTLEAILHLSSLGNLRLGGTKVSSAGIAQLVAMPQLSTLVMDECDVGDEVRVHLSAMARLQSWSARNTRMTTPDFHDPNGVLSPKR